MNKLGCKPNYIILQVSFIPVKHNCFQKSYLYLLLEL